MLNEFKLFVEGLLIIALFFVLLYLNTRFGDYVYQRIGISRDFVLCTIYIIPGCSSFIMACYAKRFKLFLSLLYLFVVPFIVASLNYIGDDAVDLTDFPGLDGSIILFKIIFFLGFFPIVIGSILGFFISKIKSRQNKIDKLTSSPPSNLG